MNKTALLYPGTGSQYTGMFKGLYEDHSIVRETFQEAAEVIKLDLAKMCFEDGFTEHEGIAYAQVAILVCSVAGHRLYMKEIGLKPYIAAGHSLGEWSALTCAGAFELADAVKAVWQRGKWMEEAVPEGGGLIAAVSQLSPQLVQEHCRLEAQAGYVIDIACSNSPDQVVIAGHTQAVEQVMLSLEPLGAKIVRLRAKVPFHTSLMQPAAEKLAVELSDYSMRGLEWPVISNVTAFPHSEDTAIVRKMLADQLTTRVRWEETIRLMQREGVQYAIEIGPQKVLKQLNRKTACNIKSLALDVPEDWSSLFQLRRLKPDFMDQCLSLAVSTRNNNWNAAEYEKGAVEPYKRLLQIHDEWKREGIELSHLLRKESLQLVQQILACKQVSEDDQLNRLAELAYQLSGEG